MPRLERLERCAIPARAFIIRFPNGDFEYDLSRSAAPTIGSTIRRQGELWSVVRVNGDAVSEIHVEKTSERSGVEDRTTRRADTQS